MSMKTNIATLVAAGTLVAGVGVAAAGTSGSTGSSAQRTVPASSSAAERCPGHDGEWPDAANGRPKSLDAGDTGGVYMWHDADGWHLRVTHKGHAERIFSGRITTPGTISAQRVRDEKADKVVVGPNGHTLEFRFTNYGAIDGVDFHTTCAPRLNVSLRSDGAKVPVERIFIGHAGSHPLSDPFTIQRAR